MSELISSFLDVNQPVLIENTIQKSDIVKITSSLQGSSFSTLNSNTAQIIFRYSDQNAYVRLASDNSGIYIKLQILTRANNADSSVADITLSSNWYAGLFREMIIKVFNETVEHLTHPQILLDVMSHILPYEFRYKNQNCHCTWH